MTDEQARQLLLAAQQAEDANNSVKRIEREQLPKIEKKVDALSAGGGQVDLDALANKVADKLAERLKS